MSRKRAKTPVPRAGHQRGQANALELQYADQFLKPRKRSGEVIEYHYETARLRLCHLQSYTPDWTVKLADGTVEHHEVKGWRAEPQGWTKVRIAAALYPNQKFFVCQANGKNWRITPLRNDPAGPLSA
jgi:hypothetical protein